MSSKSTAPKPANGGAKNAYLILYNLVSAGLWGVVLVKTAVTAATAGTSETYSVVGEFTKWTQTLAGMEVLHALLGVVRAPVMTTVMQVASRFLLVWGVVNNFPQLATSPAYSSMLIAWSVTEVIRYSFFVFSLSGSVPGILQWFRYNTFFVLYPLGISSECWLVYKAIGPAAEWGSLYSYYLMGVLAIYVPGSYVLYTHMMTQRRKVLRGKKAEQKKKDDDVWS